MRQAEKLTITCDGAVVSFQDINGYDPVFWDSIPDVRQHLAWPVDNIRRATSAVLITLESVEERKRLYAFDDGAQTMVAPHSALCIGTDIIYIVGYYVARLDVANWRIVWRVEVDLASCFGVYADPDDPNAVIIHGELVIAKLSLNGDILWKVADADIFVDPPEPVEGTGAYAGGLELKDGFLTIQDWNGWIYTIATATGEVSVRKPGEDAPPDQRSSRRAPSPPSHRLDLAHAMRDNYLL